MFEGLTFWDWGVCIVLGASILFGVFKGFIKTVFGLAAWACAVLGSVFLMPQFFPGGLNAFGVSVPAWVGQIVSFLIILVLVQWLGRWLAKWASDIGLGGADRLFGAALGGVRGVIVLFALVALFGSLGWQKGAAWDGARTKPFLELLAQISQPWISRQKAV